MFGLRGRGVGPVSAGGQAVPSAVPASLGHARESLLQVFEGRAVARLVGAQRSPMPQVRRRLLQRPASSVKPILDRADKSRTDLYDTLKIGLISRLPMTYCVGILVEEGLVMIADTRTNAGLDDISTYRKLSIIAVPGERVIVLRVSSTGEIHPSANVVCSRNCERHGSGSGPVHELSADPLRRSLRTLTTDCERDRGSLTAAEIRARFRA